MQSMDRNEERPVSDSEKETADALLRMLDRQIEQKRNQRIHGRRPAVPQGLSRVLALLFLVLLLLGAWFFLVQIEGAVKSRPPGGVPAIPVLQ
jgi:hypothetical protein